MHIMHLDNQYIKEDVSNEKFHLDTSSFIYFKITIIITVAII